MLRTSGLLPWSLALACLLFIPGCSLAVMGGKMLFGDMRAKSQFRQATHTNLVKANKKVLVLCSAVESIRSAYPSADFDILEGVTHRLKVNGIKKIVNPDAVGTWLDDHGGHLEFQELQEMAEHFHATYLIHIEVTKFTCLEDNSPNLLRGQSEGHVHAYRLDDTGGDKRLLEVLNSDFNSTYPQGSPISIDKKSVTNFEREYVDRISTQLSQIFYDHAVSQEIN